MPTVQDADGLTLIKQNVGIKCHSDNPYFVRARGEVSDLEGYYCVVSFIPGSDIKGMPRFVKVSVMAVGENTHGKTLYSESVTEFEVQLTSDIRVETRFRKGVHLDKNHRAAHIAVFSSTDFKVDFDYLVPEETQLVKYQLSRIDPKSNEYSLTVQVPNQVSHSFDVNMVLHHANARKKTVLHLRFTAEAGGDVLAAEQAG